MCILREKPVARLRAKFVLAGMIAERLNPVNDAPAPRTGRDRARIVSHARQRRAPFAERAVGRNRAVYFAAAVRAAP
jgi:hypothetical protein